MQHPLGNPVKNLKPRIAIGSWEWFLVKPYILCFYDRTNENKNILRLSIQLFYSDGQPPPCWTITENIFLMFCTHTLSSFNQSFDKKRIFRQTLVTARDDALKGELPTKRIRLT